MPQSCLSACLDTATLLSPAALAAQVIVATPGRLWDLMRDGQPHVTNLDRLSFLVIDEAGARLFSHAPYRYLGSSLLFLVIDKAGVL